jgi:acyl-CoA hydrolase
VVRGTVTTPVSGSKIVVTAFAASRLLAKPARQVSIGSQTKKSKSTGKTSFSVKLKASARRALQRRHRLALTLRIVVTSPGAKAVRSKVAITLRDH